MSADTAATLLIALAGVAYTLFVVLYAATVRWWDSLAAIALMISSSGLMLLINISLLYQWLGDDYYLREVVRLTVFFWIGVGGWVKLVALVWSKFTYSGRDRFKGREL